MKEAEAVRILNAQLDKRLAEAQARLDAGKGLTAHLSYKPLPRNCTMKPSSADIRFIRAAIALSLRGLGRTSPNPNVGCVIVRDGIDYWSRLDPARGRPMPRPKPWCKLMD